MSAKTLSEAACLVLAQKKQPMSVADLWTAIEQGKLCETSAKAPDQSLRTQMLRGSKGVAIASGVKDKRFYKAGPGTFGLLEWLSAEELKELDLEEAIAKSKKPSGNKGKGTSNKRLAGRRLDPKASEAVFDKYCPSSEVKRAVAEALLVLIREAQTHNPASWNLTYFKRKITLNVGLCLAFGIRAEGVWISVMSDALSEAAKKALSEHATGDGDFKNIVGGVYYYIPPVRFAEVWALAREGAIAFVAGSAKSVRQTPHTGSHSPGGVDFLASFLGTDVPSPKYEAKASDSQNLDEQFITLFDEFSDAYLEMEKGSTHLLNYAACRASGRANFEKVKAKSSAGEDITDDVLLQLLPHSDTAGNRQRGAWIHLAPAITKDLKSWFEGAKWVSPEDWPRISTAVWEFIRDCEARPEDLATLCERFGNIDYIKGMQTGMLTPILNALRPDDFFVINGKSRKALNHFTSGSYPPAIVDYPATNAALHAWVEKHRETLNLSEYPEVSASDVFDVFSHWLIGIRKDINIDGSVGNFGGDGDLEEGEEEEEDDDEADIEVEDADSSDIQPTYTKEMFMAETGFSADQLDDFIRIISRKKQVVLQGPPGTGKTYVAERLAKYLVSSTAGLLETVQFHPAYSYEDFMRGIRPRVVNGTLSYEWENGRFVTFCGDARDRKKPCVLIIDEINRANLARVFGELMYLLEYRSKAIPLAGGEEKFAIPSNVIIIGTMNTADRSIARLDHALRRRFSFVRIGPEYEVMRKHLQRQELPADSLVEALKGVNKLIDDPNYEVGISYFMRPEPDLREHLADIWKFEIETYLDEFFYDQSKKLAEFRWNALKAGPLSSWV